MKCMKIGDLDKHDNYRSPFATPSSIVLPREMRKITLDDEMSEWKIGGGTLESQACSAP